MKAIVLTYDRNAVITEHMIACYDELWPDHPFIFRIPFNEEKRILPGARKEFIRTSTDIKSTVLSLLDDLDDEEWIYWCIDDKYPIRLETDSIMGIYASISNGLNKDISGILFCRARKMLDPGFLSGKEIMIGRELLLERKAYQQIWIHQFLRVKVIRHMFLGFPDVILKAKIMDDLKDAIDKPGSQELYVTSTNYAVFGESTRNGVITENCLKSLSGKGYPVPDWQPPISEPTGIIGKL